MDAVSKEDTAYFLKLGKHHTRSVIFTKRCVTIMECLQDKQRSHQLDAKAINL